MAETMFIGGTDNDSSHGPHLRDPTGTDLPPLGDMCAMGEGKGGATMEVPADEGTRFIEAVEASYEEQAASLSSNKGTLSLILLVHVFVYSCMHIL